VPRRLRRLTDLVAELDLEGDPATLVASGEIEVEGFTVTNPEARVAAGARVARRRAPALRGEAKLRAALGAFDVAVAGRVALDVGAAAGGFTRVLLEAGARRVYAVDAGHGQLLGSLRQDPRVLNLEATNVAALDRELIPEVIEVVTVDVTYLSLSAALAQLAALDLAPGADLVGLVKPMFELRRATAPVDDASLDAALAAAIAGAVRAGWGVMASMVSPVLGARGARELLLHARRGPAAPPEGHPGGGAAVPAP
jgi:23S rRNA (cytidine1920-2'-O)/16S rRNA (cytidine1409-2'-O)-methyltransferase